MLRGEITLIVLLAYLRPACIVLAYYLLIVFLNTFFTSPSKLSKSRSKGSALCLSTGDMGLAISG